MTEVAVRISGLHKRFGDVVAVEGLDLEVYEGEIFGLLGPNGAGKTTTIKLLLGLTNPSDGWVEVLGLNPTHQAGQVRARTGYAMQQVAVDLYLTGRENLRVFAELFNIPAAARGERIKEILEWAGLTHAADRLVRTYSGGMRRRLNLALSLLHRPELFFLDEPTLGLDVHSRRQLWRLIGDVTASGTTIIMTTHYLEEANQLCDRVGIMDRGRLVAWGTPQDLKRDLVKDLHRLTITFREPPSLGDLDLPTPARVEGPRIVFTGSHAELWRLLGTVQCRFTDKIREASYSQPTLDDLVLKLTQSQAETQARKLGSASS